MGLRSSNLFKRILGPKQKRIRLPAAQKRAFLSDAKEYQRLETPHVFPFSMAHIMPKMDDRSESAGTVDGHYFLQDLFVAQEIYKNKPLKHVDIGSRVDGFISHLLVFRDVHVIDIRPLPFNIPNLHFIQDNAVTLEQIADNSLESISCLHVIEHFGLGRYGDPIDPQAPWAFAKSLIRVLQKDGLLYLSTPVGREKLYFNAHRVWAVKTILDMFKELELVSFHSITANYTLTNNQALDAVDDENYACGIFIFKKV